MHCTGLDVGVVLVFVAGALLLGAMAVYVVMAALRNY